MISDEQLILQIKQGDEAAFETLIRRYHGPIHAYISRMGCEFHAANDLVQEVFIKVCRNLSDYRTERPFRPWIYTIASNTFKDYLKKAYVRHDRLNFDDWDDTLEADDNLENRFMANAEREIVIAALGKLGENVREIVVLRYYQDLKLNEIAEMMQIPLGTVKSRLFTALRRLKDLLAKEVGFNEQFKR